MELVIKNDSQRKAQAQVALLVNFTKYRKIELLLIFLNPLLKIKGKDITNSFFEARIILIPKPEKDVTRK